MNNLQGKVAYITGGSKGIGYGIAESLLQQGMNVAITSRSMSAAEGAARNLDSTGQRVLAIESDVRSLDSESAAIQSGVDKWGKVDALVANARCGGRLHRSRI